MKKNITINENLTVNDCVVISTARFPSSDTVFQYLVKKPDCEEREVLIDAGLMDRSDKWFAARTCDGAFNDDSFYTGWDCMENVLKAVYNEVHSGPDMEEVNGSMIWNPEEELQRGQFVFELSDDIAK